MSIMAAEITDALARLAATPTRLAALTSKFDPLLLQARDAEAWSVVEILAHLRVCAEVWGQSIQTMLEADHPTLRYVSPRTVAKKRNYTAQAYQASYQLFAQQRNALVQTLQPLPVEAWSRGATFTGTTKGREQTVFSYVQRITAHEEEHLAQIEQLVAPRQPSIQRPTAPKPKGRQP